MLPGFIFGRESGFDVVERLDKLPVFPGAKIEQEEVDTRFIDKLLECRINGHLSPFASLPGRASLDSKKPWDLARGLLSPGFGGPPRTPIDLEVMIPALC